VTDVNCSSGLLRLMSQSMNLKHLDLPAAGPTRTPNSTRGLIGRRRSNRMSLQAPVGISGEDRLKCSFTMPARASNLNKHGAAVQLSRDLVVGSVILVRNKRGVQVSARIVAQLRASDRVSTYGIEFVDQDDKANNFWGISFPSNAD